MGKPGAPLTLVALTALAFVVAGCGGDDDGGEASGTSAAAEDGSTTATAAEPTTTAQASPEDQVWNDLVHGTEAFSAVAAAPNPDAPELMRYFTGDALQSVRDTMRDLDAGGSGSRNSIELHRYSVAVDGETATVDYCFVDTSQRLDTAGEPAGTPEVTTMRATAEMERIDGVWKTTGQMFTPEECAVS